MRKIIPALALAIAPMFGVAQARLVINGTSAVTIVESGGTVATPIYIELANPAANAITVTGTNGWIVSEAEYNKVKWDISNTTGSYTVPFGYGTSYYLPLSMNIGTAGSSGGSIIFSTYHTDPDNGKADALTPYTGGSYGVYPDVPPSSVTNMASMYSTGLPSNTDNSYHVVDRFWVIDPSATGFAYGTKPALSLTGITFTYIHAGLPEFGNQNISADENQLIPQRFNPGAGLGWGDWLGTGPQATGVNTATSQSGAVSPANFFRSWTLSDLNDPLPITLSSFTAQCDDGTALIQWTSQTEVDNSYYTIEKTTDNVHFEIVGKVNAQGTGNSSLPENYQLIDNSPYAGESYYFIYQTDIDGTMRPANIPTVAFTGCETAPVTSINAYNTTLGYIQVSINSVGADNYDISLVDMLGQTIFTKAHSVVLGENDIRLPDNVNPGVYILNIRNDKTNYSKKMVLGVK